MAWSSVVAGLLKECLALFFLFGGVGVVVLRLLGIGVTTCLDVALATLTMPLLLFALESVGPARRTDQPRDPGGPTERRR